MKVPPKRKGNLESRLLVMVTSWPSMKVPPKRKGNFKIEEVQRLRFVTLNESPSEKEGKFYAWLGSFLHIAYPQ